VKTKQKNFKEFATRDLYLATVLKQAGIPILRVEGNGRQGIFISQALTEIDKMIPQYFNGELRADPRGLFDTWKSLKSMAYSAINNVR